MLESARIFGGRLVLSYLSNATASLRVHGLDGAHQRSIELPTLGSVAGLSGTSFGEYGEGYLRFSYANSQENLRKALDMIRKVL